MNDALPVNIAPPPAWYELLPRLPLRVAAIGKGEAILAGELRDPVTMGRERLVSKGGVDLFVSRMDASGKHLWAEVFGGPGEEAIASIAARNEELVLVGSSKGGIDFGGGALPAGAFLAKLSGSGSHVWSKAIAGATVERVRIDGEGSVVALIHAGGPVDFGSGPMPSPSGRMVAKLDRRGQYVWSKTYSADVRMGDIGVTRDGDVIVVGSLHGSYDFGAGMIKSQGREAIIVRYGKDGSFQWSRRYRGFDSREARVVAVGDDGNLFVHQKDMSGPMMVLYELGPSGDPLWSKHLGGLAALAPDGAGGVIYGTTSFDSGVTFLGRFDDRGTQLWERMVARDDARIDDLTVTTDGLLLVVGRGSNDTDLGGVILNPTGETGSGFVVAYLLRAR